MDTLDERSCYTEIGTTHMFFEKNQPLPAKVSSSASDSLLFTASEILPIAKAFVPACGDARDFCSHHVDLKEVHENTCSAPRR